MKRPQTGEDVLQHEILGEQAATIGRLATDLQTALDALAAFDARERASGTSDGTMPDKRDPKRLRLVDAAAYALWHFVVQRDCMGFRFTEKVLKDYAVPADVRARMGVVLQPR
jgi:hypothetical protein